MLGIDEFNFSDRIAKGVDDNGDVIAGALIIGDITNNKATGTDSHAEGSYTTASGRESHAEGSGTNASGIQSHAEGGGTRAVGDHSHSEGAGSRATGDSSHAEGSGTTASGSSSHSEGAGSIASGSLSHAEGGGTTASGAQSHTEGISTIASGTASHAEGDSTVANHKSQHVFGEFNIEDSSSESAVSKGTYIEIVGNGTNSARSNARTLDWNGNEVLAGKLTVGAAPTNTMDVSTKGYVDTAIADAVGDITSFEFQVVTELPATGTKGIIYLRAHSHGDNDAYDEYIWVTDRYERLGTLDVDLSNYVTFDDYASASKAGVVKIGTAQDGIIIGDDGIIKIPVVNLTYYRNGNYSRVPVTIQMQHMSAFYGLAKAAGDTTQSQSSNAVGTYTDEAKTAIKNMIGITDPETITTSQIDTLFA